MNPFASTTVKEHLFNIANGKAALGETADFLTKVWTIGFSTRDYLNKDCNDDPNAYQSTINQEKIKNFASKAGSYNVSGKNKSLVSVSMTRISLEASCTMPCKQRLTWSKYLDNC